MRHAGVKQFRFGHLTDSKTNRAAKLLEFGMTSLVQLADSETKRAAKLLEFGMTNLALFADSKSKQAKNSFSGSYFSV